MSGALRGECEYDRGIRECHPWINEPRTRGQTLASIGPLPPHQPYLACVCCLVLWPCALRCSSSTLIAGGKGRGRGKG